MTTRKCCLTRTERLHCDCTKWATRKEPVMIVVNAFMGIIVNNIKGKYKPVSATLYEQCTTKKCRRLLLTEFGFSSPTNFARSTLGSSTLWYLILLFSCWWCCRTALSFHGLSLVGFLTGGTSVRPMSKGSCTSPDKTQTNI